MKNILRIIYNHNGQLYALVVKPDISVHKSVGKKSGRFLHKPVVREITSLAYDRLYIWLCHNVRRLDDFKKICGVSPDCDNYRFPTYYTGFYDTFKWGGAYDIIA